MRIKKTISGLVLLLAALINYWTIPMTKYSNLIEQLSKEEVVKLQEAEQLNNISKEIAQTEDPKGLDPVEISFNLATSFANLYATADADIKDNKIKQSVAQKKNNMNLFLAQTLGDDPVKAQKVLESPETLDRFNKELTDELSHLPETYRQQAVAENTQNYAALVTTATKKLIQDQAAQRIKIRGLYSANIEKSWGVSNEAGKAAEEEATTSGLMTPTQVMESRQKGLVDRAVNDKNLVMLYNLSKNKAFALSARNEATKQIPNVTIKLDKDFQSISTMKSAKDYNEWMNSVIKSGDPSRQEALKDSLRMLENSFHTNSNTFAHEDSQKFVDALKNAGMSPEDSIKALEALQTSRSSWGSNLYNLLYGENSYQNIDSEEKKNKGLPLIATEDMSAGYQTLLSDPDNIPNLVLNVAKKNGIQPIEALSSMFDYAEANTPDSDKITKDKLSILRALYMEGANTNASIPQLFQLIEQAEGNIPSSSGQIDSIHPDFVHSPYGADLKRLHEIEVYAQLTGYGRDKVTPLKEDFKETFNTEVDKRIGQRTFLGISLASAVTSRPDFVPRHLWNSLSSEQKANVNSVNSNVTNPDPLFRSTLDEDSQDLYKQGFSSTVVKNPQGFFNVIIDTQDGSPPHIVRNKDGTVLKFNQTSLMNGQVGSIVQNQNFGATNRVFYSNVSNIIKGLGIKDARALTQLGLSVPEIKPGYLDKRYTIDVLNKQLGLKKANGTIEKVSYKRYVENALTRQGINPSIAPLILLQYIHESGWEGKVGKVKSKKIKLSSGEVVKVSGLAQLTDSNVKMIKETYPGIKLDTPEGALQAMTHIMANNMKSAKEKLLKMYKNKPLPKNFNFAILKAALKNYNGGGFNTEETLSKILARKGSSGADESRNYGALLTSALLPPTADELDFNKWNDKQSQARYNKIRGKKPPYAIWRARKQANTIRSVQGILQGMFVQGVHWHSAREVIDQNTENGVVR